MYGIRPSLNNYIVLSFLYFESDVILHCRKPCYASDCHFDYSNDDNNNYSLLGQLQTAMSFSFLHANATVGNELQTPNIEATWYIRAICVCYPINNEYN